MCYNRFDFSQNSLLVYILVLANYERQPFERYKWSTTTIIEISVSATDFQMMQWQTSWNQISAKFAAGT